MILSLLHFSKKPKKTLKWHNFKTHCDIQINMFCILSTHIYYIPRAFTPYLYFLEYALFLRRGNKVLIQKIKIICGYNTDLVKNEARNFPKTNKGFILIWHTQDAFGIFHILFYISHTKKMTYVHYCGI